MKLKPQQTPTKSRPGLDPTPQPAVNWQALLWYLPMALLLLWIWQDYSYALRVHTIPYSEFKAFVAKKQVPECQIQENEILGIVDRRSTNEQLNGRTLSAPAASKQTATEDASTATPATRPTANTKAEPVDTPTPDCGRGQGSVFFAEWKRFRRNVCRRG
ncbi:MAG: hypothetical protein KDB27_00385, partial [Planctomycetales bacterium]|nr:hypothetical protein [Planctomycetales bacterium]